METLNSLKNSNRELYLKLNSLNTSLAKDPSSVDTDALEGIYNRVLESLENHKNEIIKLLDSVKKRKKNEIEIETVKRIKPLFAIGDSVIVKLETFWIMAITGKYLENLDKYTVIDAEDSK